MGIRTRRARTHSRTHIVAFSIAGFFGFMALAAIAVAFSMSSLVNKWLEDLPDYNSADAYMVAEPTRVYDANGKEIVGYYLQNRRTVSANQISPWVLKGTVDTEDVRFYTHNGIDPQGILRAVYVQLLGGSEGASTITQQLVRNTILSDEQFDYSVARKVREAYIAIQMEKKYTKDQILLMYLNTIYYGHGAYGIEAASITYFNKHAADLTLSEAAALVAVPQAPSYFDPLVNPEACKDRRNLVLNRMYMAGDLTLEERDAAMAEELVVNPGEVIDPVGDFPYFTDYVKSLLLEDFDSDAILQGGLKVYTTIDPAVQSVAERAVWDQLDATGNERLEGAMVVVDVETGYIKAMVSGRDYSVRQYNLATQPRRQCGSVFKIFPLVSALGMGMNPSVNINGNSPLQVTPTWECANIGNTSYGIRTFEDATANSINTIYAQVAEVVGADKMVETAYAMGIDDELPAYLSISIGSVGVPPVQMAEVYATLAAGGVHRDTVAITRIEDRNGNVIYEHQDNPTQAISPAVAETATGLLEKVITDGTATEVKARLAINQPVAGKTGTTDDTEDLWFCGITPQYSVCCWAGYPDTREMVSVGGERASTANTVQPMFVSFVNSMLADTARKEFPVSTEKLEYQPNQSWHFVGTDDAENDPVVLQQRYYEYLRQLQAQQEAYERAQRQAEEEARRAQEEAEATAAAIAEAEQAGPGV